MWYEGHWSRTCCTTKHLVDLYQASLKKIKKNIEMNFIDAKGLDLSYYDVDFFGASLEKTYYLMDDENVIIELYIIYVINK